MIIRIISLILWLLLGVFYFTLYSNSKATCCSQESAIIQPTIHFETEDSTALENTGLPSDLDKTQDSIQKLENLDSNIDEQISIDNPSDNRKKENALEPEKAVIFFPQNSKTRLTSETLEKYLDDIAERVIQSKEIINLYGHTDKLGTEKENITLGLARAKTIRDLLIKREVPSSQITVQSMGSKEPIGNNKTREGRSKNRRVELFIK